MGHLNGEWDIFLEVGSKAGELGQLWISSSLQSEHICGMAQSLSTSPLQVDLSYFARPYESKFLRHFQQENLTSGTFQ